MTLTYKRIGASEAALADDLFSALGLVFGEPSAPLGPAHLERLFCCGNLIAIAALDGRNVAGGLTAFVLPMTASESLQIFIYDVAVRLEYRRRGVGTRLMKMLLDEAAKLNATEVFVQVDNHDRHALAFYDSLNGMAKSTTEFTWRTGDHLSDAI